MHALAHGLLAGLTLTLLTFQPSYACEPSERNPRSAAVDDKGRMQQAMETVRYARQAGWPEPLIRIAAAIAMAESEAEPDAIGDEHLIDETWGPSLGLMQVRSEWSQAETGGPRDMYRLHDPLENMRAALALYRGEDFKRKGRTWYEPDGFDAWSTYNDGKYKKFLPAVERALGLVDRVE